MWNVLTVPTVWYFNCPRQSGMFLLFDSVVFYLFPTIWNVLTATTVWNFNCPRQCVMFLPFRQFGILTVTDNAEYFYCSNIVVF